LDEIHRNVLGDKLVWHAKGPMRSAVEYSRYVSNGMLFRILFHDNGKTSQNCGVCMPTVDGPTYYGKLTRIIEVQYYDESRYVLFKCDWADIEKNKGYKEDEYGIPLVSFKRLIHKGDRITDDPYVLSSQVSQVYYVEDERHPDWAVVVSTKPRHVYDIGQGGEENDDDDNGNYRENEPYNRNINADPNDADNDNVECARDNVPAIEVSVLGA
jgi:hypothetical protein